MQIVNLNMITYGLAPIVHASRYDIGREFRFDLYNFDVEYVIPDNTWVIIHGLKPDSHTFAYSNRDTNNNGVVRYEGSHIYLRTTQEMTDAVGNTKCEFILRLSDGSVIGSINWTMRVETGTLPNDVLATTAELIAYQKMMQSIVHAYTNLKYEAEETPIKYKKLKIKEQETLDLVATFERRYIRLQKLCDEFNKQFNHIYETTLKAGKWEPLQVPVTKEYAEDEVLTLKYDLGPDFKKRITYVILDTMNMTEQIQEQWPTFTTLSSMGQYIYMYCDAVPTVDIPVIIGYTELTGKGRGNWNGWSSLWKDFEDDTLPDDYDEEDDDDAGDIPGDDRCCCKHVRQV